MLKHLPNVFNGSFIHSKSALLCRWATLTVSLSLSYIALVISHEKGWIHDNMEMFTEDKWVDFVS